MLKRVVITGLGAITPIGNNIPEFWNSLKIGVSGCERITYFNCDKFKTQIACQLKGYNPENYFNKKELKTYDPCTQYAVISADEAIINSHIDLNAITNKRVGVIWGSGIGGVNSFFNGVVDYLKNSNDIPYFHPLSLPRLLMNMIPGIIAMKYKFQGVNFTTSSACASSAHAVISAMHLIQMGKADIILAGGSEASICEVGIGAFNALMALSTKNNEPQTASRPFDASRDGFVMGEGGGALILEEYEHALKRNATIFAEIIGGAMTDDAFHITAPDPQALGSSLSMNEAILDAGIRPQDINYINVHAPSTQQGDIAEIIAIQNVFGEDAFKLSISSTKSMTGHMLGAAGAIELIASVLAMKESIVPPTINNKNLDPKIDPRFDLTLNTAKPLEINYALSNSFGFGGQNASIIIKKN